MTTVHPSVLSLIGRTPAVAFQRLNPPDSRIMVKLEGANPGRSVKDRAALNMVDQAERSGQLTTGGTIIESTSGNLGKSLALIGAVRGYRVVLVVDPKTPEGSLAYYRALGAEVVAVEVADPEGGYQRARIAKVQELLASDPTAFWPDQYRNPDNPAAHTFSTARELEEMADEFDTLVASVSTGGHLAGISRVIKESQPGVRVIAVDAHGSAALGGKFTGYKMRGMGLAWEPDNLETAIYDSIHLADDIEGIATMRAVARIEGILVGESSGAVIFAALAHAVANPGARILCIAADDGANYITESFLCDWDKRVGDGQPLPNFISPSDVFRAAANPLHPSYDATNREKESAR